jgi:hypothetical protein
MIVMLWRGGLRVNEALALSEHDLDPQSARLLASRITLTSSTRSGVVDSSGIARSASFSEGVLPGEKRLDANEPTVSHDAVERELLVQLDVAAAAAHFDVTQPEDRISQVTHLAFHKLEDLPGVPHRRKAARRFFIAAVDGLLHRRGTGRNPLDLGRCVAEPQVGVASVPSFDPLSRQVHVRLRHRLPPLLREAFGGSTGLVDVDFGVGGEAGDQTLDPQGIRASRSRLLTASKAARMRSTRSGVVDSSGILA